MAKKRFAVLAFLGGMCPDGYIEVHHLRLLSKVKQEIETSLDDVIVVCSNCHRILHKDRSKILDWKKLKKIIDDKNEKLLGGSDGRI